MKKLSDTTKEILRRGLLVRVRGYEPVFVVTPQALDADNAEGRARFNERIRRFTREMQAWFDEDRPDHDIEFDHLVGAAYFQLGENPEGFLSCAFPVEISEDREIMALVGQHEYYNQVDLNSEQFLEVLERYILKALGLNGQGR